ncbi:hypothetical protein [Phenylobacterium soli]|uniref:DUF3313 domain-containing protein n=1 Tax=Phenylobacterium soli TaxID=2170551 RepID=A0A328AM18_9CAUL|nr:hypothetical protein [Phenylobacterium soli]RAK55597.1 hypothetical protein DJ017_14315 [Phenylobacterium soli]
MRYALAASALLAALLLAGCMTTSATNPDRVQTTGQAERENLKGAMGAPLRDLNVLRTKIPPVLLEAMADPYYRPPGALSCGDVVSMMEPLNNALGADLDTPSKDEDDLVDKGRGTVLGAVAGATSGVIPFRGWVRKLTGAEKHDSYVQAAITAGAVRRGYLKGLGESRGCPPPATPSHVKTGQTTVVDQSIRSRYPTKLAPASGTSDGTSPADPPR